MKKVGWDFSVKYYTIDKYYQFKNSKLFQKIFYSIDDE